MDCICFKRKRSKTGGKRKNSKHVNTGQQNSAFVDDDLLTNNAVLAELQQREETELPQATSSCNKEDGKSSPSPASRTNSVKVIPNSLSHQAPSSLTAPCDKSTDSTPHSQSQTQLPSSTQDDLVWLDYVNYECSEVELVSRDSVGPGFSVTGTLTDGIIIGSLTDKGPALESGKVSVGDRILSVRIEFGNMTYEDALTILSYAAPYPMTLELARGSTPLSQLSASPTKELHDITSEVYHPVYRSQSVGAGTHASKKQKKIPSRPGTSLSQLIATQEIAEGSETPPEGSLVKDKFGNTLNLIDASDSNLHRLSDSDTTVESCERSDSNGLQNSLEELSEELSTSLNMQKSHGLSTRNLDSPITIASGSAGTTDSKAVAAEIKQLPPEKPKRVHQLVPEKETTQTIRVNNPSPAEEAIEEEVIPTCKVKDIAALPDWVVSVSVTEEQDYSDNYLTHLVLAADEAEKHDTLNEASSPVPEPIIESSQKTTCQQFYNWRYRNELASKLC
ncbi:hypothetical protein EB796_003705 [Bugula neritina]|uniref:PDZ domain-containing protein n=1 Tax=Bugula neritina TaxID=10212 RepID=A0A7J7KID9_BUGNE|nr:hypothetical protein EB796_003705 [Bugula neritina]